MAIIDRINTMLCKIDSIQTLSSKHYLRQDVTFLTNLPLLRLGSLNEFLFPSIFNIY